MPTIHKNYKWGVLGHSQLGASHVRQGLPNQDAFRSYGLPDGSCPIVVAVADGHGSAKSFRSHVGAALAAETAVQVCIEFLEGTADASPSAAKNAGEQQIPLRIFQTWKRRVAEHFARNPFTVAELDRLAEQSSVADRDRMARAERPQLAYGSTLLAAFLTNEYLMAFQLGDGDILAVSDSTGEVGYVIPKDESLIANETTSLCQDDAHKYVRCRFQLFQDHPPGLVMLSTDGYANSFATSADFQKVGTDYLDMLQSEGKNPLQKNLPEWLEEASREGSGDDITLGMIYRIDPALAKRTRGAESIDANCSAESKDLPKRFSVASSSSVPEPTSGSDASTPDKAAVDLLSSALPAPPFLKTHSPLTSASSQVTGVGELATAENASDSGRSNAAPSNGSMLESGAAGSRPTSTFDVAEKPRIGLPLKATESDARPDEEEPSQRVTVEARRDDPNMTESRGEPKSVGAANDQLCSSPSLESTDLEKTAPPSRSLWKGLKRIFGGSND